MEQPVKLDEAAFKAAAKPLMDYLANNHHPHIYATVDSESAMLIEGLLTTKNDD